MDKQNTTRELAMLYGRICETEVILRCFKSRDAKVQEEFEHAINSLEEAGRALKASVLLGRIPNGKSE